MKICTCDSCHYIFMYPLLPLSCPDCGKDAVRPATVEEIKEYWKNQEIIEEEIRMGLIKSVGSILDKKEKDGMADGMTDGMGSGMAESEVRNEVKGKISGIKGCKKRITKNNSLPTPLVRSAG